MDSKNQEAISSEPDVMTGIHITLASLPRQAIIYQDGLARALGVCVRTIRRMRDRDEIPPPIKIGGRLCWLCGTILDWLEKAAKKSEYANSRKRRREIFE